jgi:hypothetical protein
MTHKEYTDYFRDIAVKNKTISHDLKKKYGNFYRIIDSEAPFPRNYIVELLSAMKSNIDGKRPVLVSQSYTLNIEDNKTGAAKGMYAGIFYVIHKAKDNYDAEHEAVELCEKTALQILAKMGVDYSEQCNALLQDSSQMTKIAGLEAGFFGVKARFSFIKGGETFDYDEDQWNK